MTPTTHPGLRPGLLAGGALAALALLAPQAIAQEDYYANRDITMVVAFGPGGGYDIWGRAVANHLGRHLPGNPNIIVENMPGAGTLVATNHIFNIAPRDGTVIGIVGRDVFLEPLLGNNAAQFDLSEMTFIGSAATEANVCVAMSSSGVETVEDLTEEPIILGAMAPGNGTYKYPMALNAILGLQFDVVHGYESSSSINMAMEQGEVEAICESYDSIASRNPAWIEDGVVNVLFQGGVQADPNVDAPFILDFAETDEQRAQIRFLYAGQFFGRPFIAPPMDEEPKELLRAAFDALGTDEAFLAEVESLGLEFAPVSGADMEAFAIELENTPQELVEYINEISQ